MVRQIISDVASNTVVVSSFVQLGNAILTCLMGLLAVAVSHLAAKITEMATKKPPTPPTAQ